MTDTQVAEESKAVYSTTIINK